MNGVNARNTKPKGKEWIILSTIPPDSLFLFLFNRFVGGMKNQIVHWNAHTWNQKLASCSKSAFVINLIWKTTYQAVHSYQMLKFSKLHSKSAKGISSSPAPLSPLPSSRQHFKWQQVQETSVLSDSICLCERIRANCYIMPSCSLRDGDVWKALSGKRWSGFPPAWLKGHKKTNFFPMKLQMLSLDLTQRQDLEIDTDMNIPIFT